MQKELGDTSKNILIILDEVWEVNRDAFDPCQRCN